MKIGHIQTNLDNSYYHGKTFSHASLSHWRKIQLVYELVVQNSTTAQTTASQLQFPSKYESSFRVDIETDLMGKYTVLWVASLLEFSHFVD